MKMVICYLIMPIIKQPLFPGIDSATGLGDIKPMFFLSPATKAARYLQIENELRILVKYDQTHSSQL
jgi:hypothetical protein